MVVREGVPVPGLLNAVAPQPLEGDHHLVVHNVDAVTQEAQMGHDLHPRHREEGENKTEPNRL